MMRFSTLLLAWALLGAGAALAADRLDDARAQARQARAEEARLRGQQSKLKGELDALGARIEALKARGQDKLLPGGELDASLKRSQELSGALTELATALERAHGEADRAHAALAAALSDELARLRAQWDRSGHEERAKLLERMRAVRAERESLREALPAAQVPALLPAPSSDDPAELLEQADALRDAEDKVKKRLMALESRIREAREERELDRRMGEFTREGALFDEQDRRLRLDHDPHQREVGAAGGTVPATASDQGAPGAFGEHGPTVGAPPSGSRPPSEPMDGAPGLPGGDELKSLEAQRAQLQQLAGELERKAAEVEQRARALK